MSDAQLFQYANTTALCCWVILILIPRRAAPILRLVVPVGMALLYIWALTTAPANPDGGFGSLAQVKALFAQDRALLAGWVHYLAFDLFVGCWMVLDAPEHKLHRLLVVPCLLLTFMFGPAGLLLYYMLRLAARQRSVASQ
ncbi:ABA4-like family protein [Gemmatimonas sp.]|uniref:ABA4-like family protein n=1 Tax=Gemmatimonas sp. TaxID=1962908 RepID=UPI003DA42D6B